jgi:hypothetical protein
MVKPMVSDNVSMACYLFNNIPVPLCPVARKEKHGFYVMALQ